EQHDAPSATSLRTNSAASMNRGSDFSRLMMWILLRSPKMYGAIFGFQKRVWCPKWTPASSIRRIVTSAIGSSLSRVEPPRAPAATLRPFGPGTRLTGVRRVCVVDLPERRALYTIDRHCATNAPRPDTPHLIP